MLFEHLIYSTAIAIIAGMIHVKKTGRDYSWIIIVSALAPDLDIFTGYILTKFDTGILINGNPLKHGDFHNIAVLFLFALLVGSLLKTQGMKFKDSFIFAGIGFSAHMLEDALVFNPAYAFLWPLSTHSFGIGIIDYKADWYGLANAQVLLAGIIFLIVCATVRSLYEGKPGLPRTMKALALAGVLLALTIPVFWYYQVDENFKGAVRFGNVVDGWQFTQNASWDPTVSHNGSHSARIDVPGNESKKSGIARSLEIPVKPDTNYTFLSWGKTEGTGGNNSPAVRLVQLDLNKNSLKTNNLIFGQGTNSWTQKQINIMTYSNATYIYIYANIWGGYGTFWFDDVDFHLEGDDQNIIPNNGFEMGVNNIIEITSFKNGAMIFLFVAIILLLSMSKYFSGKKVYKIENKDKTGGEHKGGSKGTEKRYHIIAIGSGKGGVGKTTIAANLGIMLSKLHKKVTIIDMDLAMPNLEIITGLKSTPVGLIDVLEGRLGLDSVTYAGPEGIKIIPPGMMLEGYSKEDTKQKIIELLKNLPVDNDYIILDLPPGRESIDVLSGNDIGVLLVVNSNKPSILDAVNIKVLLDKKNVNILGVILNRYARDPELIDEIEKALDSKVVAVIPESKIVNDAYMFEECFVVKKGSSDPSKELMDLAKEIIGN
jgi:septum site-determining protein MinD